jgi:peptidylprolyl isomerase
VLRSGSVGLALCLLLSACGTGSGSARPAGTPTFHNNVPATFGAFQFPTVSSDELGIDPTITSSTQPPDTTMLKVLHQGSGPAIKPGAVVVVDYKGQPWEPSGAQLPSFVDTFASGDLFASSVDKVVPGWSKKLPGMTVGSRVLLIVPPSDAFGIHPPKDANILPNDTLMFVIDVLDTFPPDQGPAGTPVAAHDAALPTVTGTTGPKVTIPSGAPPKTLQQELLVRGKGDKVADGQWLVVQYTGLIWGTGKIFDSTWTRSDGPTPIAIRLSESDRLNGQRAANSLAGVIKGLVGHTVGSRVLLVIPPDEGYGAAGNQSAGVAPTDTMVFVIDILGAYRSGDHASASPTPPAG